MRTRESVTHIMHWKRDNFCYIIRWILFELLLLLILLLWWLKFRTSVREKAREKARERERDIIRTIGGHKVLIDEGASLSDTWFRRINTTTTTDLQLQKEEEEIKDNCKDLIKERPFFTHLTEETLTASTRRCWIVDVDVVILGRHRFLHKRFIEGDAIHLHMILRFYQFMSCTQKQHEDEEEERERAKERWITYVWDPVNHDREPHTSVSQCPLSPGWRIPSGDPGYRTASADYSARTVYATRSNAKLSPMGILSNGTRSDNHIWAISPQAPIYDNTTQFHCKRERTREREKREKEQI